MTRSTRLPPRQFSFGDVLLAPIYLYQAKQVKRQTLRLPEPEGERQGSLSIETQSGSQLTKPPDKTLNVMIVGDSAAAGVGVSQQTQALSGNFNRALVKALISGDASAQFSQINWQLHAKTGDSSFDVLQRLYAMPARYFKHLNRHLSSSDMANVCPMSHATHHQPVISQVNRVNVALISIGVNDVIARTPLDQWQANIQAIIDILQRKFEMQHIVFTCVPPMAQMPALPYPLNRLIGRQAMQLDNALIRQCQASKNASVHYLRLDFNTLAPIVNGDVTSAFAQDGFHPSELTYQHWGEQAAQLLLAELASHRYG